MSLFPFFFFFFFFCLTSIAYISKTVAPRLMKLFTLWQHLGGRMFLAFRPEPEVSCGPWRRPKFFLQNLVQVERLDRTKRNFYHISSRSFCTSYQLVVTLLRQLRHLAAKKNFNFFKNLVPTEPLDRSRQKFYRISLTWFRIS